MIPNSFTFRQILQILLPGLYLCAMLLPIQAEIFDANAYDDYQKAILFSIISILLGVFIYTIEIPKTIWFFKKYLPTEKIPSDEYSTYFEFYDNKVSKEKKDIIERYTSLFHFCINISFSSILLIIIYLIIYKCDFITKGGNLLLMILILSFISSLLLIYGPKRIKFQFEKQLESYYKFKNNNTNN